MSVCSQLKFTRYLAHEYASLKMLQEVGGGGRKRFAEDLALKGEGETL